MFFKKIFYKFTNKKNYQLFKIELVRQKSLAILKSGLETKINEIQLSLKKNEISFLHSGHLGDIINALPVIKELSKNHKCSLYLQIGKPLPVNSLGYKHETDNTFMSAKMVEMILPLLKSQKYINKAEEFKEQEIDIDLDLFRQIPMNFNLDEVRWYFHLTGVHTDLSKEYLFAEPHPSIKDKIVIMRSIICKNIFINYNFMNKYKNVLFIGLKEEYEDLKKEIPNMQFYDCKDFLEAAQIIKSSKFFIGNSSLGFTIAEGLKVPRIMESYPDFPIIYPNGGHGYDFYFQTHFEMLCEKLNKL